MGLIWVSIRFCPAVTKLKVPTLPVRIGTGLSVSDDWADAHAGNSSRSNATRPGSELPCRRRDAVFLHRYNKGNPSQPLAGIVFQWHSEGNITEVTFVSHSVGISVSWGAVSQIVSGPV